MNSVEIKRIIKLIVATVLGFSVMILLVPILLPLLLACWCVSQLAFLCIRVKYGNVVSKPCGMDIVNGKESEISRPYINIAFRFTKRNPDVEKVRERFQKVILDQRDKNGKPIFNKFKRIFERVDGYYIWRDCNNFDLKNHIRLLDKRDIISQYLAEKRKKGCDLITLKEEEKREDLAGIAWEMVVRCLLCDVGNHPVKENIPKWEILILPESENRYTTLFRVHHSITDGLYFVRLISECLADVPVDVKLPFKVARGNWVQRFLQDALSFSLLPMGLYRALSNNDQNPLHGPKLVGTKRFLLSEPISVSLLKDIKRRANVTINDLIFSCVSFATAKHFESKKASIEDMMVLLAVNLQEQNKPLRLKNNFAVTALKLPTSTFNFMRQSSAKRECTLLFDKAYVCDLSKLPALCRLQIVKNTLDEAKKDPCLMSLSWLVKYLSFLLPASIAEAVLSTAGITMDISNIQGPQSNNFVMNDAPAEDVAFWLPDRDPLGIGVSIVSYNGHMRMGLIVDEAIMKNDEEGYTFLSNIHQEVHNIQHEISSLSKYEKIECEITAFLPKDIP